MRECGPIEAAVLRKLHDLDEVTKDSPLAASAVHLARVHDLTVSARDVSAIAKQLRDTWAALLGDAEPATEEVDELAELRARHAGNAGTAGTVGS